jgi:hypothetical protein
VKLILAITMIALIPGASFAGSGHGHHHHNHEASVEAAPKGGMLRDCKPYRCELLLMGSNAYIHVYEKKNKKLVELGIKQLAKKVTGKVRFPKETKEHDVVFTWKKDKYHAKIKRISRVHRYDLHIMMKINGKDVMADFGVDNVH